jgi:hypothetical protein
LRDKKYVDNRYGVAKGASKQRGNNMVLTACDTKIFIEQVAMICDLHSIQTNESSKDNCVDIIALIAEKALGQFKVNSIHAEVANDDQVTSR